MIIGEDIKENVFHIRILVYLLEIYPKKAKSFYEIAEKGFKTSSKTEYYKAGKELVKIGFILEEDDGYSINPEKEQFKPLLCLDKLRRDTIIEKLKRNEQLCIKMMTDKHSKKFLEDTYTLHKG